MPGILSLLSLFVVVFVTFPSYTSAAITDVELRGLSVTVHGTPYLISPFSAAYAPVLAQADVGTSIYGFVPVTVIHSSPTGPSRFNLNKTITGYLEKDDVFSRGFLQGVIIYHEKLSDNLGPTIDIDSTVTDLKNHYNTSSVMFQSLGKALLTVPPGPYFYHLETGHLHHPYRLYPDTQMAFVSSTIPSANGSYAEIPASISGTSTTVGVPSRLYFSPTPEKPLAGVHVAIKDIFDIKGVKTGAGSRAYRDIYPPATAHSTAVQRFHDAGAVIVGKVKTAQFAAPENAIDAIDYQAPFNPRGDGYQEPGSSSSGPGVAVASYDWLHAALGSDTGGSVRIPAALNGVFGNRPTHGLVDLHGAVPLTAEYDTAGLLSRDPFLWSLAADVLYGKLNRSYSYPKKLTVLDFTRRSPLGEPQQTLTTSFINSLASYLSADVSTLNYTSHWEATRPSDAPTSVKDLLKLTWIIPCAQNQARTVRDPFYADYAEKFNGRLPFTNPSTLGMWKFGDQYPDLLDDATRNKTIFRDWWSQNVIQKHPDTCSDSIALYIANEATPEYINNYGEFIGVLDSMQSSFISVFTEQPEYVLPLGESPYYSDITEHEEVLPVTVNIMAASGCDGMLFSLVEDLTRQGIIAAVGTGARIMSEESL